MIGLKIVKVADGAYFVPSYSVQTITPSYEVWGTVHAVGAADELRIKSLDDEPLSPSDELVPTPS